MKLFKFLLAFLVCFSVSALADMYAVYGIHVDVTAENATVAKEQGVTEAQEKAFYKMLDRLTLFRDLESLPVLATEDILNLVRDFSVSHEKTSSVRYIADVDVQFDPEAIQKFFQDHRVPYVMAIADKALIFPVYKNEESADILLWKDTNPWSKILSKAVQSSDLIPLVVPLGDLDDMAVVSEDNWKEEDNLDITPLLQRYGSVNALVAELTVVPSNNVVKVIVRPFQNKDTQLKTVTITEPIDAPLPVVLKRSADRVIYLLEQSWREQNAVRFDDPTQLSVNVDIKDLSHWLEIRKQLDKMVLIKQYVVKALRRDKAEIEIFYVGDFDAFKNTLRKDNLFLSQNMNGDWLLRSLADVPPEELEETDNTEPKEQPVVVQEVENTVAVEEETPKPNTVPPEEVHTFDLQLYQQVQPETMEIFQQNAE